MNSPGESCDEWIRNYDEWVPIVNSCGSNGDEAYRAPPDEFDEDFEILPSSLDWKGTKWSEQNLKHLEEDPLPRELLQSQREGPSTPTDTTPSFWSCAGYDTESSLDTLFISPEFADILIHFGIQENPTENSTVSTYSSLPSVPESPHFPENSQGSVFSPDLSLQNDQAGGGHCSPRTLFERRRDNKKKTTSVRRHARPRLRCDHPGCGEHVTVNNMKAHKETHDPPNRRRRFHCEVMGCPQSIKGYTRSHDLKRHCLSVHGAA